MPPWARPSNFTAVGNRAFFSYDDGTLGNTLWITDGTTAGTKLVQDILPGPRSGQSEWQWPAESAAVVGNRGMIWRPSNSSELGSSEVRSHHSYSPRP